MTILNWRLSPDRALVLSDTLAVDIQGHSVQSFIPKAFALPHICAVVAANGSTLSLQAVIGRGAACFESADAEAFAGIVGPLIRAGFEGFNIPRNVQGQVVLFGWSETYNRVMGWAWRSENKFELEILPDGDELHPAAPGANLNGSQEDWLATGLQQQAWTEAKPGKRYIGGRLIAHEIIASPSGCAVVQSQILGALRHFDADTATIARVSPDRIPPSAERWARCEAWLASAEPARGIEFIRHMYTLGVVTLIDSPNAAAIVEVAQQASGRVLHIFLGGGSLRELTDSILPRAERVGRNNDCSTVIVSGRRGWGRALRPYGYRLMGPGSHPNEFITMKALSA